MEKKIEIKEEDPVTDNIASQHEREFVHKVIDAVLLDADSDMTVKTEIKLETPFIKHTVKQTRAETVTCSHNWEIHGTNKVEHNRGKLLLEDPVIMDKQYSSDQEIHSRIEIKEQYWCLETETSSACDNNKEAFAESNQEDQDLLSSQLPSFSSQGVSEESGISTSLIHSGPREHCQMEEIPSHLKTAKFAVTSSYEYGRSEKSFKLKAEPRPYKCNKCEKSFKQKYHLDRHLQLHSDTRLYKCDECEKSFKQKYTLDQHILLHLDTRLYRCEKCEKSFKQMYSLSKHIRLHSDTRPYKCYNCEKSFKQKSDLNKHIRLHSDIRPYKCDRCEKSFKQKCNLNKHVLIHSDTTPYKCNICEKSFKQKYNLDHHILFHSDTRPYKCEICEKSFKQKSDLNKHIQLHSDTKPYKCFKCVKSFTQKSNLNRHVLLH